jgi:hypothetical protein
LYDRALARGQQSSSWSGLTRRSRTLLSLAEVFEACTIQARSSAGQRVVAIAQIRGSENRAVDFDCDFNPLQEHTRDRWLGIAAARQRGRCLPPVALIQVGDRYFVRDGHHRISVARALGQETIEATVEVWQVDGPLPWEHPAEDPRGGRLGKQGEERPGSILGRLSGLLRPSGTAPVGQAAG